MKSKENWNPLTPEEARIIENKGTEYPFTGEYNKMPKTVDGDLLQGYFVCRRCEAPLYQLETKFDSGCGWPSFDDQIENNVRWLPDADGRRTEIVCAHCGGHLGHVFQGERFTAKNTRHCVNSLSVRFVRTN